MLFFIYYNILKQRLFALEFTCKMSIQYGSEVCNVGVQRNNFLQLIKVIKQWKFYLNLWYKIIWYCKIINLHAKLISIIINWK